MAQKFRQYLVILFLYKANPFNMEDLFSAQLLLEGKQVPYRVVFENEKYVFQGEGSNGNVQTFSIKRENDEWHEQGSLPANLKKQAVDALEAYLLQQH